MSVTLSLKRSTRPRSSLIYASALALLSAAIVVSMINRRLRPWAVSDVPVAFWAWRTQSPSETDVRDVIEKAHARTIFLRAGQIDLQNGKLQRIRPVRGLWPQGIDLHLVYNSTRSLLAHFESVDETALANTIAQAFREDSQRASQAKTHVTGLQVDIDVPTRLLARYRRILSALRNYLPNGTQISITGLPTWMDSSRLEDVLEVVDFWVPQLYGAEIPERSDHLIPISSAQAIKRDVIRARKLDKPFYAGLAAYNCTMLYSPSGSRISLRGDMDLTVIASDPNLELIDRRSFDSPAVMSGQSVSIASNWRYAYRARADGVTDSLAMHAGDILVIETPTAESLRTAARIVRELAGEKLLGICVFRLPSRDDPATLTIDQVATALADQASAPVINVRITLESGGSNSAQSSEYKYNVELKNLGTAGALVGSFRADIGVIPGSIEAVTAQRDVSVETLCESAEVLKPCSQRRADVIRLKAMTMAPSRGLRALLVLKGPATTIPLSVTMQTDAGQSFSLQREVTVDSRTNP